MTAGRQVLAGLAGDLLETSSESDNVGEPGLPREPFSIYQISERMLYQHTRLNRDIFNFALEVISPALTKNTRKGRYQHLTPMHKLYVTLQFYATGSYQWLVDNSGRISQSAVSHASTEVTEALVAVSPQFIRFPNARDYSVVKQAFYQLGLTRHSRGFPKVLGAIDCTHVRIQAPKTAPEQYLNRHLYHSINVQLIVGPDLTIFNTFTEFPGSNYDSFIWRNSAVRETLAEGTFSEGWLMGTLDIHRNHGS
ncbi:DDE Tnp 4 and/or Plant tran domain containing protein [Asbolus verrucosus]|uniref:DDE Tnp 4 and/or Plant tran domain containing protein n=1 Tax=Asbolus verrucosus TaxID=1661398 RepID=A0A482W1I5_ASBVE|nr:DDE Tnp 4 and/or Plant tran domain containing protein [Asbolus verrucosus]